MKTYKLKISILVLSFIFFWVPVSWASLNVVTTTSDLASIVKEVGGSLVKVESLVKGYQNPHYIQPKPSYMVKMNRADLLIYQGLELEIGWLSTLIEGARNPDLRLGQTGHLDASTGISRLETLESEVDRSMGDIHPSGNPHYNLDPENGFIIAQSIYNKLSELDSENATKYKSNLEKFNSKLEKKIIHWKNLMKPFKGTKIITYHKLWSYFAKRFDLNVVNNVEVKPGVPPTTKHLAKLTALMNREDIKVILQSTYYESDFAKMVAGRTEAIILVLPSFVGGTPETTDYFSLFDTIIQKLTNNLQPST